MEQPRKLTPEERLNIQERIASLEMKQYAIKIIINSIYGAFGNKYFYFHNNDIAQSITIQGQDLIKFSIKAVNHYFINKWHIDTALHSELGILGQKIKPITEEASIYADTDSTYVNFQLIFDSIEDCPLQGDEKILFCEKIIKHTFADYLDRAFEQYGIAFKTENIMSFKLENISESGIWVAKKSYVLKVKYDRYLLDGAELLAKGIDYAKPTFPLWARDKMKIFIELLLIKGRTVFHEEDIIPLLAKFRKEMDLCEPDDIAFNYNVTKYNDYIESIHPLKTAKGIPIRARSAAYHNYLIEETGIHKYTRIRQGNKIKFYYAKYPDNPQDSDEVKAKKASMNVYGYIGGDYPLEFAIPVDKKEQFFMILVQPVNKLLNAMGLSILDQNLRRSVKIVLPKPKKITVKEGGLTFKQSVMYKPEELLPLYAVNPKTFEYHEIPNKFSKYIMDSSKPLPKDKDVLKKYVENITIYRNDTVIVAAPERDKFIKTKKRAAAKKRYKLTLQDLPADTLELYMEALDELKRHGFKQSVHIEDAEPVFTRNKTKKEYILKFTNIIKIQTLDQYLGIMKIVFADELKAEEITLQKKLERERKKRERDAEKARKAGIAVEVKIETVDETKTKPKVKVKVTVNEDIEKDYAKNVVIIDPYADLLNSVDEDDEDEDDAETLYEKDHGAPF